MNKKNFINSMYSTKNKTKELNENIDEFHTLTVERKGKDALKNYLNEVKRNNENIDLTKSRYSVDSFMSLLNRYMNEGYNEIIIDGNRVILSNNSGEIKVII